MTTETSAPTFAAQLRRFRERRGLSQCGLSFEVGVDHSYIGRMEAGKRLPSLAMLASLYTALGLEEWECGDFVRAAIRAAVEREGAGDAD